MWHNGLRRGLIFLVAGVWLAACAGGAPASSVTPATTGSSPTRTAGPQVTVISTVTPVTAATTAAGPTAAATDTAGPAPAATGSAGSNGCPAAQAPAGVPAPDVTVSAGGAGGGAAQLAVGQTLEVRLPAGTRWSLAVQDPAGALAPAAGNGWFDTAQPGCVWRFTGRAAGAATLTYNGRAICKPGTVCANFVINEVFEVTVSAGPA